MINTSTSSCFLRNLIFALLLFMLTFPAEISGQELTINPNEYLPDLDGILKTKVEFDLNNSLMRFEVRNARFGVKGKINKFMSYKAELDLSDEGKLKMLDAYVKVTPVANLDLYLGQRKIPFSSDYVRNPAENIFANRSFLAKYINEGMRDIGFYADYKIAGDFPFEILAGAVNGTGNNNPKWISRPNIIGRISAGPEKGIRFTQNMYFGASEFKDDFSMLGEELRYANGRFFIESEYIRDNWTDTLSARRHTDGMYIHSYYNFTREGKLIYMITPTARWDMMGNSVFGNKVDASRITLGINVGFEPRQFYSEIRLNYENYLKHNLAAETDKITLEFIARF